jgi:hypothetical protein
MTDSLLASFPDARPASDFPGAWSRPLEYPGSRPADSYLFAGGSLVPIVAVDGRPSVRGPGGLAGVDDLLRELRAAPISRRHAVLAVGSNACPGRLLEKFPEGGAESVIPVLRGAIAGVDAVYLAWLTAYAALPATCLPVDDADVELWLTLLSPRQFEVMNASESLGESYGLIELPHPFRFADRRIGPVYAYSDDRILALDGEPVRLSAFPARRSPFRAMDEPGVLGATLDRLGFREGEPLEERHRALVTDERSRTLLSAAVTDRCRWRERPRLARWTRPAASVTLAEWR